MIVTLCGSLRFEKLFRDWDEKLTLAGHVVFNCAIYPRDKEGVKDWYNEDIKSILDLAHLQKIAYSDAVVFLNRDNYVGSSGQREIIWAHMVGKPVYYLEVPEGVDVPSASELLHQKPFWKVPPGFVAADDTEGVRNLMSKIAAKVPA